MSSRRLARPDGLPSGPKARSASVRGQNIQQVMPQPGAARRARPKMPVIGLPPPRDGARFASLSPSSARRPPMISPNGSDASSLFDVKRSWRDGSASPNTSIEEDVVTKSEDTDADDTPELALEGKRLWDTVASVASVLTVNVSKAWSTSITMESGEETPPGEESRITRALKAYHINKVRDPSELPEWLFEPHERMAGRRRPQATEDIRHAKPPASQNPHPTTPWKNPSDRAPPDKHTDDEPIPSKAVDRLKAFREKRKAQVTSHRQQPEDDAGGLSFSRQPHEDDQGYRDGFARRGTQRSLPSSVRPPRTTL